MPKNHVICNPSLKQFGRERERERERERVRNQANSHMAHQHINHRKRRKPISRRKEDAIITQEKLTG